MQQQLERRVRICVRSNGADTKVCEETGRSSQGTRAETPLQPMVQVHPCGDCGGPHTRAGCPKEAVTLWETHDGAGSVRTTRGKNCTLYKGLPLKQSVRSPPSLEEGAAQTTCDELTTIFIPCPLVKVRRWQKSGVRLRPGKRKGWGESV